MSASTLRRFALLMFAAISVPIAAAGHVVAEAAALRSTDNLTSVVFAPRHAYIGLALGCALLALAYVRFIGRRHGTRAEELVRALPFGGQGVAFTALAFAVQLAAFVQTQLAEGCPIAGGDVIVGLLTAIFAAAAGSLALSLCRRRIIAFVLLGRRLPARPHGPLQRYFRPVAFARFSGRRGAFLFSIANRPPPAAAVLLIAR